MSAYADFCAAADARHGVGDLDLAVTHGVEPHEFYRNTAKQGWEAPFARVRIRPGAAAHVKRDLVVVCSATRSLAAASGATAAWLHGARSKAPNRSTFVVAYGTDLPRLPRTRGRRARWLRPSDVGEVEGVPTLVGPAVAVSAAELPERQLRAFVIDLMFHGVCTPEEVLERLDTVGPIRGRGTLIRVCEGLAGRDVESIFQDEVCEELERLGYRPDRSTRRIETPDGRGLRVDVALADWLVALEPEGDAFHRTRAQRRADRRRLAAYAGTDWVPVPIDWRDWRDDRDHVLAAIDAAIAAQRRRGIGVDIAPPRR